MFLFDSLRTFPTFPTIMRNRSKRTKPTKSSESETEIVQTTSLGHDVVVTTTENPKTEKAITTAKSTTELQVMTLEPLEELVTIRVKLI